MSKILGIAAAAITLVMALACGGSNNGGTAAAPQYKISGEVSLVSDPALYKVGAFASDTAVEPVAKSDLTSGSDGLSYTLTVPNATNYFVKMYKFTSAGPVVDTSGNVFSIYTDYRTGSTTGTGDREKVASKRQMNSFTTFVSRKISSGSAASVDAVLTSIFGTATSMSAISFEGDTVLVSGKAKQMDPVAKSALTQFSYVAAMVDATVISSTAVKVNANFTSLLVSFAAATTLDNVATSAAQVNVVATAAGTNEAAFSLALKNISPVLASTVTTFAQIPTTTAAIATQYASLMTTELTNSGVSTANVANAVTEKIADVAVKNSVTATVALTVSTAETAAKAPVLPNTFTIVNGGSSNSSGFSLTSTSPIFKVTFVDAVLKDVSGNLNVTINGVNQTSNATNSSTQVWSTDRKSLYILLRNDSGAAKTLAPGKTYTYALTSNATSVVGLTSLASTSGTILTSDITFSDSYSGLNDTPVVKLEGTEYQGIKASALSFVVNSKTAVSVDKALVTALSYTFNGTKGTLSYSASDIEVSPTSGAVTTATVTLASSVKSSLAAGSYVVTPTLASTLSAAPTSLTVDVIK